MIVTSRAATFCDHGSVWSRSCRKALSLDGCVWAVAPLACAQLPASLALVSARRHSARPQIAGKAQALPVQLCGYASKSVRGNGTGARVPLPAPLSLAIERFNCSNLRHFHGLASVCTSADLSFFPSRCALRFTTRAVGDLPPLGSSVCSATLPLLFLGSIRSASAGLARTVSTCLR